MWHVLVCVGGCAWYFAVERESQMRDGIELCAACAKVTLHMTSMDAEIRHSLLVLQLVDKTRTSISNINKKMGTFRRFLTRLSFLRDRPAGPRRG